MKHLTIWRRVLGLTLLGVASFAMLGQAPSETVPSQPTSSDQAASEEGPIELRPTAEPDAADESATSTVVPPTPTQLPQPMPGAAITAGHNVAIIPIEGMIYGFVFESLQRRVDRAVSEGATLIVIKLDTPGGEVGAALDITNYLKQLSVPTVAWIDSQAYSAGTMIASACDEIIMSPNAVMGDAAPIVPGQTLGPTERAKILSPVLEDFRDNAQTNGYDFAPFHAMVTLGVEVYYIEHKQTGERRLVNQADFAVMVEGRDPDARQTGIFSFGGSNAAAEESVDIAKPRRQVSTDADLGQWTPIEALPSGDRLARGLVHDGQTLLTINQRRAMDIGLVQQVIATQADLATHYSTSSVVVVQQTWSEQLSGWLTHPMVRGILVIGLLLGAYIEFQSPGLGVPGAVAAICLVALIGAPLVVGLAEIWHILLFLVGLGLLILDLTTMAGFGLFGIVGLLLMFGGLILASVPASGGGVIPLPSRQMWDRLFDTILYMTGGLFVSIVGFYFITKYYQKLPWASALTLAAPVPAGAGAPSHISGEESVGTGKIEVGQEGRVTSTGLRPSGRVDINGEIIDVVSMGGFIDPGTLVKVLEVRGNRVVVESV